MPSQPPATSDVDCEEDDDEVSPGKRQCVPEEESCTEEKLVTHGMLELAKPFARGVLTTQRLKLQRHFC